MITSVDDGGMVGAGKHISHSCWSKQLEHDRLRTENNLLTGTQLTCTHVHVCAKSYVNT